MVNSEAKTNDLLSDGTSPANSTGNTPDSGDALESPESSSVEGRIAKDVKLKRGGKFFLYVIIKVFECLSLINHYAFLLFNLFHIFVEGVLQNYFAERGDFRFLYRSKVHIYLCSFMSSFASNHANLFCASSFNCKKM